MRIKHMVTNPLNKYVDDSGICPVYHINFVSRARVLTHVSETRIRNKSGRRTCRQRLMAGELPLLSESCLTAATLATRTERRDAQRRGRTRCLRRGRRVLQCTGDSGLLIDCGQRRPHPGSHLFAKMLSKEGVLKTRIAKASPPGIAVGVQASGCTA